MRVRTTPTDEAASFAMPGTRAVPVATAEDTGGAWEALELTLAPGAASPSHTLSADKVFYVARGEVTVELDGQAHELGAGSFVHVPAGAVHRYRATAAEPATLVVIVTGDTQVAFLRGMGALGAAGRPDPERVAAHAAAHGVHILAAGPRPR